MTVRALPGISFKGQPPAVADALPRMDIAGFVGFAASGPLHTPVVIEDIARFHDIYGEDLAIAWDRDRGEAMSAYLPPTVRAFFRNGGQRCWIVRVAGNARSNAFPIPGLLRWRAAGRYEAACAPARSEGSWSDELTVNAAYTRTTVPSELLTFAAGTVMTLDPQAGARLVLQPGELLRVDFESSRRALFLPAPLRPVKDQAGEDGFWFQRALPRDDWHPLLDAAVLDCPEAPDTGSPPHGLPFLGWNAGQEADGTPRFELRLSEADARLIRPGTWLQLTFTTESAASGSSELLLQVSQIRSAAADPVSSPPGDQGGISLLASHAWWVLDGPRAWREASGAFRVAVLNLELTVRYPTGEFRRLRDLGFTPTHPRFWGYLPTDRELFTPPDHSGPPPGAAVRTDANHPRFALAGSPAARQPGAVYLPLGVPDVLRADFDQPAIGMPSPATALARNGIARFGPEPFLDSDLEDARVSTLLEEAFHKRYQIHRPGQGSSAGSLLGLHALLPIEEISLVAVPDAVHGGWEPADGDAPETLAGPTLDAIGRRVEASRFSLSWSAVPGATSYAIEESEDPRFFPAERAREVGTAPSGEPSAVIERRSDCPRTLYFRVRANRGMVRGPWSNTRQLTLATGPFEECERVDLVPPELRLYPTGDRRRVTLEWSIPEPGVDAVHIEQAGEPAFATAQLVLSGNRERAAGHHSLSVWTLRGVTSYFRIAVRRAGVWSPWSATLFVTPPQDAALGAVAIRESQYGSEVDLRAIHQAVLRFCAARGDVFAVLSLPAHFREDAAVEYKERLAALMRAEEGDRTLSFGALYHPWPVSRGGAPLAALRREPPDGALNGVIAQRTLSGGAWLAPANRALRAVVALEPSLAADAPRRLYDAQVNLLRQQPAGFLILSADTLSRDTDLRSIGVRRLLILLRRLALREGSGYVFEANDDAFGRRVQRQFEGVLGRLFARGAFAGRSQDEGFRVVTDRSVNPIESRERGRFVVELRVAPSEPLAFLLVRLVQSGGEFLLAEGA